MTYVAPSGTASFVSCRFLENSLRRVIQAEVQASSAPVVRLEQSSFEKTAAPHMLEAWDSADRPYVPVFYSNREIEVWNNESAHGGRSAATATLPLREVPADTGLLSADDLFFTGLQQVRCCVLVLLLGPRVSCPGATCYMHAATCMHSITDPIQKIRVLS